MSETKTNIQSVLESTFAKALDKMEKNNDGKFINDIFVQVDAESGEVQIYNEDEQMVEKTVIFDWVNSLEDEEAFNKKVAPVLRAVLAILSTKGAFEKPCFIKPFSVNLTDEDFVVIEELLFLDDDNLRLDDPLLKDLDADLDNFLAKLLSDVE